MSDRDEDFEKARLTYHKLIDAGLEAIDGAKDLADAAEHPKAFEALAGVIKTTADVNKNLLDLHRTKNAIENSNKESPPQLDGPAKVQNIFVGSTSDLQKALSDDPDKMKLLIEQEEGNVPE